MHELYSTGGDRSVCVCIIFRTIPIMWLIFLVYHFYNYARAVASPACSFISPTAKGFLKCAPANRAPLLPLSEKVMRLISYPWMRGSLFFSFIAAHISFHFIFYVSFVKVHIVSTVKQGQFTCVRSRHHILWSTLSICVEINVPEITQCFETNVWFLSSNVLKYMYQQKSNYV